MVLKNKNKETTQVISSKNHSLLQKRNKLQKNTNYILYNEDEFEFLLDKIDYINQNLTQKLNEKLWKRFLLHLLDGVFVALGFFLNLILLGTLNAFE